MPATAAGLLEREDALAAAARLLGQATAGQGGALFVLAEPGLGKTSVLDGACRNAKNAFSIGLARVGLGSERYSRSRHESGRIPVEDR